MRIYVACLASYNNGRLHGRWIDASDDKAAMQAEVSAMLRESPYPNVTIADWEAAARQAGFEESGELWTRKHDDESWATATTAQELCEAHGIEPVMVPSAEEYAIHDHEGLGDLGKYAGLDEVARRVSIAELAEELPAPLSVLMAFAGDYMSGDWDADDLESEWNDRYSRTAESWAAFAQDFTEETHDMKAVPEWLQGHIDWDSVARDFQLSGDFTSYRDGEYGDLFIFHAA